MAEATHPYAPHTSFDGGDLDCGNGLLLLIRQHIDPLDPGQLLEIISYEPTVPDDLPSWCRLTGNELVNMIEETDQGRWRFLVCKGAFAGADTPSADPSEPESAPQPVAKKRGAKQRKRPQMPVTQEVVTPTVPTDFPAPAPAPQIAPLSVMTMGSWPRKPWLLEAVHENLAGRMPEDQFQATADDAVELVLAAQQRAGVDVVTDGEMRRDNYSSFVAGRLQNCQLIPITDLLPYVEDPEEFERELRALDVPAGDVRHPAVFGPLGRDKPLVAHEVRFLQSLTDAPVKVCLPGPYLLTRTMWMECVSDRAYESREEIAEDIVRVLREELHELYSLGTAMIQIDEPVLTEVVYGRHDGGGRTFMCGALDELSGSVDEELAFAQSLLEQLTEGFDPQRLALHVCRGNWTTDESAALEGDYAPFVDLFAALNVGTLSLELATPRAGSLDALSGIREDQRVCVGVLNQKQQALEPTEDVVARIAAAVEAFGTDRVLLSTDCGFATFADNPIVADRLAQQQLAQIVQARDTYLQQVGDTQ